MQRGTYRKEKREDYLIVNECHTTRDVLCVPHDFLPHQANLIFQKR